jgi:hypothetical protein
MDVLDVHEHQLAGVVVGILIARPFYVVGRCGGLWAAIDNVHVLLATPGIGGEDGLDQLFITGIAVATDANVGL